jgi:hypothetical protein
MSYIRVNAPSHAVLCRLDDLGGPWCWDHTRWNGSQAGTVGVVQQDRFPCTHTVLADWRLHASFALSDPQQGT